MVAIEIADITNTPYLLSSIAVLLAGIESPIIALFIVIVAQNKVQGFAILKGLGTGLFIPVFAYFMPETYQWIMGVFPNFWPMKLFWIANGAGTGFVLYAVIGFGLHALFLAFLYRYFQKKMNPAA